VRRIGPTVLAACRSVLRSTEDAEDAFQVTFMVLARKAASVRPCGRVAAWLHGVALLAARKARAARTRRLARETGGAEVVEPAVSDTAAPEPDLVAVLHEELDQLPDKYRLPLVLCELRELTVAQTAVELGWPVGTVASRLSRGREALAARLTRRGLAAGCAAGMLAQAAIAAPSLRLVGASVSAALTGGIGSPGVTPPLLNEVLRAMMTTKIRLLCVGAMATAAVALAGFGLLQPVGAAPAPAPAPVPEAKAKAEKDPLERVNLENTSALLKLEEVQKALGLTDAQKKKLSDLRAEAKVRRKNAFQAKIQGIAGGAIPPGGNIDLDFGFGGPDPVLEKALTDELKPEQVRRLKQISVQAMGPAALLDRRVIRVLGLTAEQEDKIDAEVRTLPRPNPNVQVMQMINGQIVPKALVAKTDEVWDSALKVLAPEQQTK
jgi:RNA polymerase sigma factor (sigma-70 family)